MQIDLQNKGLAIRAGGALALFILTFFFTPSVMSSQMKSKNNPPSSLGEDSNPQSQLKNRSDDNDKIKDKDIDGIYAKSIKEGVNVNQENKQRNFLLENIYIYSGKKKELLPFLFNAIALEANKEYIDSVLGKPISSFEKYQQSRSSGNDFVAEISYDNDKIARSITLIPKTRTFAESLDIGIYKYGNLSGPKLFFSDATIGNFAGPDDVNDIDANQAGAGNMQCVNFASYTYKIKMNSMGLYEKVTVGYQGPPCGDPITGKSDYLTYKEQDSILFDGVFFNKPLNFLKLKINYITIEATEEFNFFQSSM